MDKDTVAANSFFREMKKFLDSLNPWDVAIYHEVKPDETRDPTLISQRVYGRRDEYLTVLAATGASSFCEPLPIGKIALPTESQLFAIKKRTGFESRDEYRNDDKTPLWL